MDQDYLSWNSNHKDKYDTEYIVTDKKGRKNSSLIDKDITIDATVDHVTAHVF
jgi:hypothetical protein